MEEGNECTFLCEQKSTKRVATLQVDGSVGKMFISISAPDRCFCAERKSHRGTRRTGTEF